MSDSIGQPDPGSELDPPELDPPELDPPELDPPGLDLPSAEPDPLPRVPVETLSVSVRDDGDASLLRLIDRLAAVLERSDLTELEVEAGETGLILRKPAALASIRPVAGAGAVAPAAAPSTASTGTAATSGTEAPARPAVRAPLTGIFYASPSPGSPPYVQVGGEVAVGQIIGLIEAMKLFNEIKSDLAGRVVRLVAESGQLVKAKQPLIEVEPL
jgi:acetyl-CoA carboxylase biotin carboxyl carrier protein